jgi:hypothetical protein
MVDNHGGQTPTPIPIPTWREDGTDVGIVFIHSRSARLIVTGLCPLSVDRGDLGVAIRSRDMFGREHFGALGSVSLVSSNLVASICQA